MKTDTGQDIVVAPVTKIVTAWGGVAIAVWVDYAQLIAAGLAALYTLILIGEWVWKKFKRCRRRDRRADD